MINRMIIYHPEKAKGQDLNNPNVCFFKCGRTTVADESMASPVISNMGVSINAGSDFWRGYLIIMENRIKIWMI